MNEDEQKLADIISQLIYEEFASRNSFDPDDDENAAEDITDEEYYEQKRAELIRMANLYTDRLLEITSHLASPSSPITATESYAQDNLDRLQLLQTIVFFCMREDLNSIEYDLFEEYELDIDEIIELRNNIQRLLETFEESSSEEEDDDDDDE